MPDLETVLSTVRDKITRYRGQGIGEQDTKAALIVPVLRALGWDTEDLEDVKLEYKRRPADNPVDYALVLLREPRLFIEAKSLGANLDDHKWANQILAYATVAGVEWVALTDGNEYWKSEFVDRQVGEVLRALFAPEPDPGVIRLVHGKLSALPRSDIKASLGRLRPTFDFPVVAAPAARASHGPVVQPPQPVTPAAPKPAPEPAESAGKRMGEGTPWRQVTLGQLVDVGLVRLPLDIEHEYKGTLLRARVEAVDRIVFAGATYDSLSIAGGMGRLSVVGPTPGHPYPPTNGWTFWEYLTADGSRRQLDRLRRDLHERKVVQIEGRRTG
jgi:hypothetical protein